MRYSTNLNIIIKALEKASSHISRDFIEIENLQSNPVSANKFTNACYNRVKKVLIDDFTKVRPNYNLIFADGDDVIVAKDSEYSLLINVIDGIENLTRSCADFTISIALIYHNNNDKKSESIAVAIYKVIGGELFYSEKGFGAYLNNRRLRVSKRSGDNVIIACDDQEIKLNQKNQLRSYGSKTLEIAYLASARIEQIILKNSDTKFVEPFFLIVREAGGKISYKDNLIIISNS